THLSAPLSPTRRPSDRGRVAVLGVPPAGGRGRFVRALADAHEVRRWSLQPLVRVVGGVPPELVQAEPELQRVPVAEPLEVIAHRSEEHTSELQSLTNLV